jgi:hypothetical protein
MVGRTVKMAYRSKIPTLLGQKQARENRYIGQSDIVNETGLTRATVAVWLNPDNDFKNLNADVAQAFMEFFGASLGDLVEVVPARDQQ